jgi:itaconate CoA-transferase
VHDLIEHPQLRTRAMPVNGRNVEIPASPWAVEWDAAEFPAAPAVNQHVAGIRAEFGPRGT